MCHQLTLFLQLFAYNKETEVTQVSNDLNIDSFNPTDESSTLTPDLNGKQVEDKSVVLAEREGECIIWITKYPDLFSMLIMA